MIPRTASARPTSAAAACSRRATTRLRTCSRGARARQACVRCRWRRALRRKPGERCIGARQGIATSPSCRGAPLSTFESELGPLRVVPAGSSRATVPVADSLCAIRKIVPALQYPFGVYRLGLEQGEQWLTDVCRTAGVKDKVPDRNGKVPASSATRTAPDAPPAARGGRGGGRGRGRGRSSERGGGGGRGRGRSSERGSGGGGSGGGRSGGRGGGRGGGRRGRGRGR